MLPLGASTPRMPCCLWGPRGSGVFKMAPTIVVFQADWWGNTDGSHQWTQEKADRGQTIITLAMMARSPLMHAGKLPADKTTLEYETNPTALEVHAFGSGTRVLGYYGTKPLAHNLSPFGPTCSVL